MKDKILENVEKMAVFNKGMGTVTIPYTAYYLMFRDSVHMDLMRQMFAINDPAKSLDYAMETLEHPLTGTGYKKAQPPMVDIEAISYIYDLPEDYVRKYLWEGEEC